MPLVVLAVAVAFSVGVALHFQAAAHDRTEREFETAVGESTGAVRSEVARSEDALRGVRGLFGAGADVRRAEFRAYVTSLALSERFPSMLGITYVSSVPAADLERFEARQRRDGAPRFAISLAPESDRRLQALDRRRIVAFEETTGLAPPLTLGYDVTARTGARAAQDHSRDTGRATLTAKLNVIPGPAPGFSLLMPVYRTGAPARTVAERRAALRGWAIARFRGPDFLANVPRAMAAKIGVELFDGDRADARNLLGATRAASHDGAMTRTRRIDAAGRTWTLRHTALPGFATAHRERAPLIALLGGLFLSLLTVALIRTRMAARLRADREVEAHSREVAAFAVMQHEFVATASHELRTPLTSIIGYLELVLDAPPGEVSEQQRGHLQVVYRGGQRLLALVGDLLTVDKVDGGAMEIEPQLERLDELVGPAVETLRPAAESKGLTLTVDPGTEPVAVFADRHRLEQVLGNVVGNAVKFTPAPGEIRVSITRRGDIAEVRVGDSGPGIPADELPRIFDRFFRASESVRSATPGTGLGLTIARSLAEAHGGSLTAESEVGRGTTFVITLPVADPGAQTLPAGVEGARDAGLVA